MHLWPWNSIANRILLRWRFAESLVNWNGTIQTLEHLQTNKQTDTETDADEISTASLRGGNKDRVHMRLWTRFYGIGLMACLFCK